MTHSRYPSTIPLLPLALAVCWMATSANAEPRAAVEARQAEVSQLMDVLRGEAADYDKIKACKRLAIVGDATAIPAVAPLLANERLSHGARLVLEAVGGPEAAKALRVALPELQGRPLVGAINSLGVLRDEEATAMLAAKLADSDPDIVAAAGAALGRIGTPEAVETLLKTLPDSPVKVLPALADACLACAEARLAREERDAATAIFDKLATMDLPGPSKLAAVRGAILARRADGVERLAKELESADPSRFAMALTVSRELPAVEVSAMVAGLLPGASSQRKIALLKLLEGLKEMSVRPAVLELVKSEEPPIRAAAVRALSTLGDAGTLPVLYEAACDSDPTVAAAARDALVTMTHPDVDAAVVAMFEKAEDGSRVLLLDLLGQRRIVAAIPLLEKSADHPDAGVRTAAIRALGQATDVEHLPLLIARLVRPGNEQQEAAVYDALRGACSRLPNKQGCAEKVIAGFGEASPKLKCRLMDVLGVVGNETALAAVAAGVGDSSDEVRDAATRVLGNWPNADAAPALLKAATELPEEHLRVRSLRGYIRIARQLDMGDHERLEMCRKAMAAAQRDEERILVLDACTRVPNEPSLAFVVSHVETPTLRTAAAAAVVSIAERIVSAAPQGAANAIEKVMPALEDRDLIRRAKEVLDKRSEGSNN